MTTTKLMTALMDHLPSLFPHLGCADFNDIYLRNNPVSSEMMTRLKEELTRRKEVKNRPKNERKRRYQRGKKRLKKEKKRGCAETMMKRVEN